MPKISIPIDKIFYDSSYNAIQIHNAEIDVDEWLKDYHPKPATTEQWLLAARWQKAMGITKEETEQ